MRGCDACQEHSQKLCCGWLPACLWQLLSHSRRGGSSRLRTALTLRAVPPTNQCRPAALTLNPNAPFLCNHSTDFEGFSSDETVRVVMSGNQEPRGVDITQEAYAQVRGGIGCVMAPKVWGQCQGFQDFLGCSERAIVCSKAHITGAAHPQGVDKLNELVAEAMREAHAKVGRGRLPLQLSPAVCCSPCVVQLVAFHLLVCSCSSNVRWQLACRPGGASPATLRAAQTRPAAHTPHSPADPAVVTPCRAWTA